MSEHQENVKNGAPDRPDPSTEEEASAEKLNITMDKRAELAISAAFVLLGALMLFSAQKIRLGIVPDPITARGMPEIAAILMIIGGLFLMAVRFRTWSQLPGNLVPAEGQEDEEGYPASEARALAIIVVSLLWQLALEPLGFLIATPIYLAVSNLIMGVRSWMKNTLFSLGFTLIVWLSFGLLLEMRFPLGPLEHLARSWGLII